MLSWMAIDNSVRPTFFCSILLFILLLLLLLLIITIIINIIIIIIIIIIINMLHNTEIKGGGWCGDMIKDRCTEGPLVETNGQKCITL